VAGPKTAAKGAGRIVDISSVPAAIGLPGAAAYRATKTALASLTRTWAAELGARAVRVNSVVPGTTRTEAVLEMMGDNLELQGARSPLGRSAHPEEIAEVVLFLASPRSSCVTGVTPAADGGRTVS
jgi:NAD(P)-dependent dehydrogenase (short-subunit alcohol dehydrogenase family)